MTDTQLIVTHFCIPERVTRVATLGEGFINDTFLVETSEKQKYILQRKNSSIFPNVPGMMDNISKVTQHILSKGGITFRLIATKEGKWYHKESPGTNADSTTPNENAGSAMPEAKPESTLPDAKPGSAMPETKPGSAPADESTGSATKPDEYWACFTFIPDTFTYEHADSLELIQSGGEGVGMFHSQLSDFQGELVDTLPGFHNIKYRFKQFSETLAKKRTGRLQEVTELVEEINKRKEQMGAFWQLIEDGAIPKRISHNDTKLSNFLFDKDGRVVCAIDLDTVMQATVLFDFGDAIRSYANRFPEDHPNFEEVAFVPERFAAFSKGYLRKAAWFLNEQEKTHLAFSALYITYEQYLRFLMDYIDGDTYYRIRYPNHNLIRARSQLALLKSMEEQYSSMQNILQEIFNTL